MLNKKICFFIGVYKDQCLAKLTLQGLRRIYREEEIDIIVISDGVVDEDFEEFCKEQDILYSVEDRIKQSKNGSLWIERFLISFLDNSDADILIKLDSDTYVVKALDPMPETDMFGHEIKVSSWALYQGCMIGFSRDAVRKILSSGKLKNEKFKGGRYSYSRYSHPYIRPDEEECRDAISVEDAILCDVAEELQLTFTELPESSIIFRHYYEGGAITKKEMEGKTFVHPIHKDQLWLT